MRHVAYAMGMNIPLSSGSPRRLLGFLLAACLLALAVAFMLERYLGIVGCALCVYQRVPYAVAAACAAIGIVPGGSACWRRGTLGLCAIAFTAGAGLAAYHVGVQQGWWLEPGVCEGSVAPMAGPLDLRAAVRGEAQLPPCDEIDWTVFGISLAALNAMVSGALVLVCAIGLKPPRAPRPTPDGEGGG